MGSSVFFSSAGTVARVVAGGAFVALGFPRVGGAPVLDRLRDEALEPTEALELVPRELVLALERRRPELLDATE